MGPSSPDEGGTASVRGGDRRYHRGRMRRKLARVFACVTATAAAIAGIAHCSAVTELIVVVDTDLAAGSEVDEIDVTVEDGAGFETHRSARIGGAGGTQLPLSLGVTAGDDPNRKVTVRAVARSRGTDVASATLRTGFVEGESKLAHVSICRSCGASCAAVDVAGASLPAWSGSAPSAAVCGGPNAGDSGPNDRDDGAVSDGGDAGDGGTTGDADAAGDPSLFAYYDFEETSGQVIDRTGRGHHADITGIGGAARGPGKIGQGIVFTRFADGGENGQLDCDDHSDAGMFPSSGTLSFWWRDDDTAAAGALGSSVTVFSNQTSAQDHFFVSRFAGDDAQELTLGFQFKTLDASTDDYANTTGANVPPPKFVVPKSVWTRIVVTWGPNGGSRTIGTGLTTGFSFYRAWSPANQRCFFGRHAHGALDEVRFYTRELTPQEIGTIP